LNPNPANEFVKISFETTLDTKMIQTFNAFGQEILLNWKKSDEKTFTADIQNLPRGMYFVKIGNQTKKLIVR